MGKLFSKNRDLNTQTIDKQQKEDKSKEETVVKCLLLGWFSLLFLLSFFPSLPNRKKPESLECKKKNSIVKKVLVEVGKVHLRNS